MPKDTLPLSQQNSADDNDAPSGDNSAGIAIGNQGAVTGPLDPGDLPPQAVAAFQAEGEDDVPPMEDAHSLLLTEAPAPEAIARAAAKTAPPVDTSAAPTFDTALTPAGPGATKPPGPVQATVQATTQAVVGTAKEATQQVTAAVQQQAQKITVAPRKAIYRGKRFLIGYGALVAATGALAWFARRHRYFVGDVGITKVIQKPAARAYDEMMMAVSELGWRWISVGTRASLSTLMWAAGFRMESAFTLSTWSGDLLTVVIKTRVLRPRPTKDLVRVMGELAEASFPSGHVVHYVTFYGFLFYLVFIHLKQRWFRTALLTLLAGIILLIGPSRIYMGHHWPSDVAGAYLVGTLWLGVIIVAYLETKANYTLHVHPPFLVRRPKQLA
jgi:membrane-associated phospholipid phosphatase